MLQGNSGVNQSEYVIVEVPAVEQRHAPDDLRQNCDQSAETDPEGSTWQPMKEIDCRLNNEAEKLARPRGT